MPLKLWNFARKDNRLARRPLFFLTFVADPKMVGFAKREILRRRGSVTSRDAERVVFY